MIIDKNKVISVKYDLRLNKKDSEVIESVNEEKPFDFIYGIGFMLKKFEEKLKGMSENESFEFMLKSDEAYGKRDEENLVEIPVESFKVDGKMEDDLLAIGNFIPMRDETGEQFNGKVISVDEKVATLDFNHPLAGEDLYFTGAVLAVREATEHEIKHGHVHAEDHVCSNDGGCGCNS